MIVYIYSSTMILSLVLCLFLVLCVAVDLYQFYEWFCGNQASSKLHQDSMVVMFWGFGLDFFYDSSSSDNNNSNIFPTNYVISKLHLPASLPDWTSKQEASVICHVLSGAGNSV